MRKYSEPPGIAESVVASHACLMRRVLLLVFVIALSFHGLVAAEPTLRTLRPTHPRLLCTEADLAQIKANAQHDPLLAQVLARIAVEAEKHLAAPPLQHRLIGPRLLEQSRAAVQHVLACALAYRVSGDHRFAEKAKADMLTAAAFPDWNPSHFLDVAEMTFTLSIGYDWLYAELTATERATIKRAIVEKALRFGPVAYADKVTDSRFVFVQKHSNWNQVCNSGLIAGALALADEEPALAQLVVDGARRSLRIAQGLYAPDGGYPEGPSYWNYGTTYYVLALAMLNSALGHDLGLSDHPGFARSALFRMQVLGPTGLAFNYGDTITRLGATAALTWIARRFDQSAAFTHARRVLAETLAESDAPRDRFLPLHALWFPTIQKTSTPLPLDEQFHGASELALFRSAWNDRHALFVGLKAGSNAANHAHLDLGSFVLDADGVRWAVDLGRDDYNLPGYFGSERWSYFRLNNHSHNTLTLDGKIQRPTAVAPIIHYESTPARALAVTDLSAAYTGSATQVKRAVALLERARVQVEDDLRGLAAGTKVHWAMATDATIAFADDGRSATLKQDNAQLRVELISPKDARFSATSARPPTPAENQNAGTQLLVIDYRSSTPDVRVAVRLSPIGERWPRPSPPELLSLP